MAKEDIKDKSKKKGATAKGKSPEINDDMKIDFEPTLNDIIGSVDEEFIDSINEVMSVGARLKRRQQMRRYKAKMQIARRRALKRRATQSRLSTRARRSAVSAVKTKLAGGRSTRDMSYGERARIERLARRRKALIKRNARKMIIAKRTLERKRLSRGRR